MKDFFKSTYSIYFSAALGSMLGTLLTFIDTTQPWFISGKDAVRLVVVPALTLILVYIGEKIKKKAE